MARHTIIWIVLLILHSTCNANAQVRINSYLASVTAETFIDDSGVADDFEFFSTSMFSDSILAMSRGSIALAEAEFSNLEFRISNSASSETQQSDFLTAAHSVLDIEFETEVSYQTRFRIDFGSPRFSLFGIDNDRSYDLSVEPIIAPGNYRLTGLAETISANLGEIDDASGGFSVNLVTVPEPSALGVLALVPRFHCCDVTGGVRKRGRRNVEESLGNKNSGVDRAGVSVRFQC